MGVSKTNYDFCGYATKNDILCSDGRTIRQDAFLQNDGAIVPLVWNHQHGGAENVLGHSLLENRDDGVYQYSLFNDTQQGKNAKELVQHGDIRYTSIYANQLRQVGSDVIHGNIREVSLVLAGANPGAKIDTVIAHDAFSDEEAEITFGEELELYHSDEGEKKMADDKTKQPSPQPADNGGEDSGETIQDVFDTLSEKQKKVVYAIVGMAVEEAKKGGSSTPSSDEGGNDNMKHNAFEGPMDAMDEGLVITAKDQKAIIHSASTTYGSFRAALADYITTNAEGTELAHSIDTDLKESNGTLAHGIDGIDQLFPEFTDLYPGAPQKIQRDLGWVSTVMSGVQKSPLTRIRTRFADVRGTSSDPLRALGYKKGDKKVLSGNIKLLKRTTVPQTIYRKEALDRDDILDITDFDLVEYMYGIMKDNLQEELAIAIMIGDGRDEGDENKIDEEHIRSIWNDDDLYCIHYDVDFDTMKTTLQGSNTSANFSENYIYAEALIQAALYSREKYKGSGNMSFYCTPHLLNIMLLARDLNGRRIYSSKAELEAALNVKSIITVEQFEGQTRVAGTGANAKTKKLLGIFVNLDDYILGSMKGGEVTKFSQFDINYNKEIQLIETRCCGALTKLWSAIALEEDVTASAGE